jgi:hypothetical protein
VPDHHFPWFHCGRCGSLFQSPPGDLQDRVCSHCGHDPSLGIEVPRADDPSAPGTLEPTSPGRPVSIHGPERSSRKKPKRSYFIFNLIAGWVLFIVIVIAGIRKIWPDHSDQATFVSKTPQKTELSAEDAALLNEAGRLVKLSFSEFISAGTPEARNQFVLSPITTAARMARFYDLNPQVILTPESISLAHSAILNLPAGRAIETSWKSTDGRVVDAVFVEQDKEWRLDWDHFARFSTYPWSLFLAGSGEPEGEFRLLARERLADQRKDAADLSIVLYAPVFGAPDQTGFQSPEFLINRDTRNGRLLDAAFKLEKSGKRVFEVDIPNPNPEGLIRVRVKVRRIEDDQGRRFELLDVIACHWYSVDVPGVEIPEAPPEK